MKARSALLLAVFLSPITFCPDPLGADDTEVGILLCREGDGKVPSALERNVLLSIGRALVPSLKIKSIKFRQESCEGKMPDATCFAGPKVILCRIGAIERVLRASAWMVGTYIKTKQDYEDFRQGHTRAVVEAFDYADGLIKAPEIDELLERIRVAEATPDQPKSNIKVSKEDEILTFLYQYIVDRNLAALLGHEAAHVFDENCPIETRSITEESGLFDKLVGIQLKGSLFCPRSPSVIEVKADRCALRFIRAIADQRRKTSDDSGSIFSFARRVAADMVVFECLTGWRRREGIPAGRFILFPQKQYLYEPFRAVLMAAEVNGGRSIPAVCGMASSLIVHGVQENFKNCSKGAGGIIPDEFLAVLPPGVEESWNGKPWTEQSYSCRPK